MVNATDTSGDPRQPIRLEKKMTLATLREEWADRDPKLQGELVRSFSQSMPLVSTTPSAPRR